MTPKQAALLLNLSYRHTKRLFKNYSQKRCTGLKLKTPKIPNYLKYTTSFKNEIIDLYDNTYYDFNIMHFNEMLEENHSIKISYESLRQIMIKEHRHKPKQKKRKHRKRRPRMQRKRMMLQMDSSLHKWLNTCEGKYWLIYLIDDADNNVPYAKFVPSDTTFANMNCIMSVLLKKGLFGALYVDKASHFITTRLDVLHNTMNDE